jgi:hypothetical protein
MQEESQEKKSNVSVYLRIRPPNSEYTFIDEICRDKRNVSVNKDFEIRKFSFNKIFTPTDSQLKLFMTTCTPILKATLGGYNGCLLAYGQTGSGKTYTVLGEPEKKVQGLLQYCLAYLLSSQKILKLEISAVQIYMEQIFDVLNDTGDQTQNIKINYTSSAGASLKNVTSLSISNLKQVEEVLDLIFKNRRTQKTKMNEKSSRSHAIFMIKIFNPEFKDPSILNVVDLAGSERVKKSQTITQKAMEETIAINSSLTCLAKCISSLSKGQNLGQSGVTGKMAERNSSRSPGSDRNTNISSDRLISTWSSVSKGHIPYRDSKLTMVLQSSISGKSVLSLLVALSPDDRDVEESFSALRFATCALKLEIRAHRSEHSPKPELEDSLESNDNNDKNGKQNIIPGGGFDTFGNSQKLKSGNNTPLTEKKLGIIQNKRDMSQSPQNEDHLAEAQTQGKHYFTFKEPSSEVEKEEHSKLKSKDLSNSDLLNSSFKGDINAENSYLKEEVENLRFANSELQFKLSHTNHEISLKNEDLPFVARKIDAYLFGARLSQRDAPIEDYFKESRKKITTLESEKNHVTKDVLTARSIFLMISTEEQIRIVRRLLAARRIQTAYRKFQSSRPKKPTSHFQKIKIAMGKNFVNQLNRQMTAHIDKLFGLLKTEQKSL